MVAGEGSNRLLVDSASGKASALTADAALEIKAINKAAGLFQSEEKQVRELLNKQDAQEGVAFHAN